MGNRRRKSTKKVVKKGDVETYLIPHPTIKNTWIEKVREL